jgi:hypothetical protein
MYHVVGNYYVIKLHSYIQVHLLVFLKKFIHLTNVQNMEHIQHRLNPVSDQLCIIHESKRYGKINTNCIIDECSVTSGLKYINIFNSLNINIQYGLYQD